MRKAVPCLITIAAAAVTPTRIVAQVPPPDAVDLTRRVLRTERESFVVLPPRQVVPPRVAQVHFSPDKGAALVERENSGFTATITPEQFAGLALPSGEVSLWWWDTRNEEAREVWRDEWPGAKVTHVWWMPRAEFALFMVEKRSGQTLQGKPGTRQELYRVSNRTRRAELVEASDMFSTAKQPGYDIFSVSEISPLLPVAILQRLRFEDGLEPAPNGMSQIVSRVVNSKFQVVGSGGTLVADLNLPKSFNLEAIDFDVDGRPTIKLQLRDDPRKRSRWVLVDPTTGKLTELEKKPDLYSDRAVPVPAPPSHLRFMKRTVNLKEAGSDLVEALWLETDADRPAKLLLAPTHGDSWMLPNLRAAAYTALDALWVASIRRTAPDEEARLTEKALQLRLVWLVKQTWSAFASYAAKHQNTYPPAGEGLAELASLAGDKGLPDGLVYTYSGGPADSIVARASTALAYLPGINGRAVLYADGHAAWVGR